MNTETERSLMMDIEGARRSHGRMCPGLAMGFRVAELALQGIGPHAGDEKVVAIVEADSCAVDAIRYFTGCTFGKGNLIHRDYGKNAFTFVRRSDDKGIRIAAQPDAWGPPDLGREALLKRVREGKAREADR